MKYKNLKHETDFFVGYSDAKEGAPIHKLSHTRAYIHGWFQFHRDEKTQKRVGPRSYFALRCMDSGINTIKELNSYLGVSGVVVL